MDIENIFIFVLDCLRYDYLPNKIKEMGIVFKGVAPGSQTRFSVPSLVSGVYPSTHGINKDAQKLVGSTFFDLPFNTAFNSYHGEDVYTGEKSPIRWWIGDPNISFLEDMSSPFLFYEHNWELHAYRKESPNDKKSGYIKSYENGISKGIDTFRARIEYLEDKDLLEKTLIVFTSDHGEILGEYGGIFDHNFPICPEITYIPIVFIHPVIEPRIINSGIASLVDIFPTIIDLYNLNPRNQFFEGKSLLRGAKDYSLCEYNYIPKVCSLWSFYGGYVRITDYKYPKIVHILKRLSKNHTQLSLDPIKYLREINTYGEISKKKFSDKIDNFLRYVPKNKIKYKLNSIRPSNYEIIDF